ncbi:MAG: dimethylsulfonioproprionate lyase family protein [Alphaproteobacteria bacterium]|nr:dimethylsulfonioproprionate lyase family protein [Alphaproteobacteria bacterium]
MTLDRSLHSADWNGTGKRPEDAFLATLMETLRRDGRRLCNTLVSELDALGPARHSWTPSTQPVVARLDACLAQGPKETGYLRGAIATMKPLLHWERAPGNPNSKNGQTEFHYRHAFCTLVGEEARVPTSRLRVGLLLIGAHSFYPLHAHAADEIYLPLSGTATMQIGPTPPKVRGPGKCLLIPGNTPHAIWTGNHLVLLAWAWLGDIQGPFRYLS